MAYNPYDWQQWVSPTTLEAVKKAQQKIGYTPPEPAQWQPSMSYTPFTSGGDSGLYYSSKPSTGIPYSSYDFDTGYTPAQQTSTYKNYSTAYTPPAYKPPSIQSQAQQFTGAVGGTMNALSQGMKGLTSNFTNTLNDWLSGKKPQTGTGIMAGAGQVIQPSSPLEAGGFRATTPYGLTKEQAQTTGAPKTTADFTSGGTPSGDYFPQAIESMLAGGITPERIMGMTEAGMMPKTLQLGNKFFTVPAVLGIEEASATGSMDKSLAVMGDKDIGTAISEIVNRDLPLPDIPTEKLDSITDRGVLQQMWDTSIKYVPPARLKEAQDSVESFIQEGFKITGYDPEMLRYLDFNSVSKLIRDMSGNGYYSVEEIQELLSSGGYFRVAITGEDSDAEGNTRYSAQLKVVEAPKPPPKETDKQAWEKYVSEYWSQERVEQRAKEREESWEWYHQKDLEGWAEYYAILEELKLNPKANEHFEQAALFTVLRRKWETTGKGKTWEEWLREYDFEEEWNKKSPYERGERPTVFAPRLKSVSY